MEAERGVPNYELQVSFSAATPPPPIHDMGFVQFEDHNQVLSFLAPNNNSHSSTTHPPLNGGAAGATTSAASGAGPTDTTTMGFCHGDLSTRPSWSNSDQVN